ncbi:MAG: hypothetical protein KatS3mg131_2174 [Candidatus Tectimicrobiota bacterium]|nr:MAG: hypothetical protein KatS3mg131_2174 [Candidatus Tectomicrobia bacterium]
MSDPFPLVRRPPQTPGLPVLVSIPHYGTQPLPHIRPSDYREAWFATFAYGFADTFVGDIYADLHRQGATVLATPYSRLFVDVNRRRNDFECGPQGVYSRRGVVRTHTRRETPIFTRPLSLAELEARLQAYYDPYYRTLEQLLGELRAAHGTVVLLDGHTGSPQRMGDYEVILGTRHGTTCHPALAAAIADVFAAHGFRVSHNVSGYAGGNIVRTYGQPRRRQVHAVQIEINAALLMTTSRQEFIAQVSRGEIPAKAEAALARCRACVQAVVTTLPAALAALSA